MNALLSSPFNTRPGISFSCCYFGNRGLTFAIPWERRSDMTSPVRKSRRPLGRPPAHHPQANPKAPSISPPSGIELAPEGLSFADVLHDCLASGVIFIDGKSRIVSLNAQAKQLLGWNPDQTTLPSLAALPAHYTIGAARTGQ
jgi:hypothetical protein